MGDIKVSFPKPCSESWDDMTPEGRNRFCARCEKTVIDLSHQTIDDVEALLKSGSESCVRARLDTDGTVAVKPSSDQSVRKMILAVGASVSLLTTGCQTYGNDREAQGAITGNVDGFHMIAKGLVTATNKDGHIFEAELEVNGDYEIRNVPPGPYSLRFTPDCGDPWTVESVVVRDKQTTVSNSDHPYGCIIIGRIEIEQNNG